MAQGCVFNYVGIIRGLIMKQLSFLERLKVLRMEVSPGNLVSSLGGFDGFGQVLAYLRHHGGRITNIRDGGEIAEESIFDPGYINNARALEMAMLNSRKYGKSTFSFERLVPHGRTDFVNALNRPNWVHVQRTLFPATDLGEEVVLVQVFDVTSGLTASQKQKNKALVRQYHNLQAFREFPITVKPCFVYQHDLDGRLLSLEDPEDLFKIDLSKQFAYSAFDLFDGAFARGLSKHLRNEFSDVDSHPKNCFRMRDFSGMVRYVESYVERVELAGRCVIRGTCRYLSDVVDETMARYARVSTGGKIAGWDRNVTTGEFHVSEQWRRTLGVPSGKDLGFEEFINRIHPDQVAEVRARIQNNEQTDEGYEVEYRILKSPDDARGARQNYVWQRAIGKRFQDKKTKSVFVSGVNYDINMEKQLNGLLMSIVDADPHFIYMKDRDGRFVFINRALADFYGLIDPGDAKGKTDEWFYQGDERLAIRTQLQGFKNADRAVLASKSNLPCIFELIIPPHGDVDASRWLATVKRKVIHQGEPHVLGISTDISTLAFEKEALEDLVRNSPAVMYVKSVEGNYEKVNKAFLRVVGAKTHQEVLGKNAHDFFHPDSAKKIAEYDQQALATGALQLNEHEVVLRDGTRMRFHGSKVRRIHVDENGVRHLQHLGMYYEIQSQESRERTSLMSATLDCLEHDYAKLFLGHILKKLSGEVSLASFQQHRWKWGKMLEMSSKYLSRLRWLFNEQGVMAEQRPTLCMSQEGVSLHDVIHGVDQMLADCGMSMPPIVIKRESAALAKLMKVIRDDEVICTVLLNLFSNARRFTHAVRLDGKELEKSRIMERIVFVEIQQLSESYVKISIDDAGVGLPSTEKGNVMGLFEKGVSIVPSNVSMATSGNGLFFTKELVEKVLLGEVEVPRPSARGGAIFGFKAKVC